MSLRNYIVDNFGWKLFSLLLAALTWVTIKTAFQRDEEKQAQSQASPVIATLHRTFSNAPVMLLTAPGSVNRFKVTPSSVSVDVSGPEKDLKDLQLRDMQAFVDLTDAQDERQLRRPIQVKLPKDLTASLNTTNALVERITNTE